MKIVCFHLNQVGDLAFSLPALKSIRDSLPDAELHSVVRPGLAQILKATGIVDDVLCRKSGINLNKLRLIHHLARENYDMAMVFSQSAECAMLSYCSRARERIGFINTSLGRFLTKQVDFHHPPSIENNLRLVEAAGIRVTSRDYVGLLKPSPDMASQAVAILSDRGIGPKDRIVALAPGTSRRRSVKEWTDEGFSQVGRHLIAGGVRVVILGTVPATKIVQYCPEIIDLSGVTNLGQVVGVLDRCVALVSVDSGVLHLAAALGKPVVGLYGPSNHLITGPRGEGHVVITSGVDCSPCVRTTCERERECMTKIEPDAVISALDSILRQ